MADEDNVAAPDLAADAALVAEGLGGVLAPPGNLGYFTIRWNGMAISFDAEEAEGATAEAILALARLLHEVEQERDEMRRIGNRAFDILEATNEGLTTRLAKAEQEREAIVRWLQAQAAIWDGAYLPFPETLVSDLATGIKSGEHLKPADEGPST